MVLKITVLDKLSVHGQFLLIYCQDVIYWGLEEHERIRFFSVSYRSTVYKLLFDNNGTIIDLHLTIKEVNTIPITY